jgi:hypothetical protein
MSSDAQPFREIAWRPISRWVENPVLIVLTGVTDEKTLKESSIHPDFIFQSIADVKNLLIGR